MTKNDAYNVVTDRIIEALEQGIVPWHRPWKSVGGNGPLSLSTGKPYRGMNVFILETTAALRGYTSPYWTTFKQAKERGGSVRKGEKGTPVVLWKKVPKKAEQADEKPGSYMLMRYFTVFNVEQCDGIEVPEIEPLPEHDTIEACETIAAGYTAVEVKHGGDRAFYSPVLDYVGMPVLGAFLTAEHYYGTLFHELAHSTGHESRLNRKFGDTFGDHAYSQEELVAEMAAAFLCGEAGIEVNVEHHAGYIASWLKAFDGNRKMIVQAAGQAQRAADLVLGRKYDSKEEGSSEPTSVSKQQEEPCTPRHSPSLRLSTISASASPGTGSTSSTASISSGTRSPSAAGRPPSRATISAARKTASRRRWSRCSASSAHSLSRCATRTARTARSSRRRSSPGPRPSTPTTSRS